VLVALSAYPERLRAALAGLRFVAAPIVIALGNASQAARMRQQHARIEQLVGELQQRTGALEEANRELQRVGRYRSLFLKRMTHELRTPLTSILGFAEILLEHEALSPAQRRFCEKIQGSGQQLHTSIRQLVDLSRLEAGHEELFLHDFSVRETLREACAAVNRLAEKQDIKLDCVVAPELGTIVSDEGKLRQVLYNFLAHAIARSPQAATVVLNAYPVTPEEFCIEIRDEGAPLTDPAHLFDPVDLDADEQGASMNELGLVIAHRLLILLGGTVALHTDAERGLIIRLTLPTRPTK
jgi:signal transduction histidine kinase